VLTDGPAERPPSRTPASTRPKYGANVELRELRQDYRHGFSILKTNRETGARTCQIYLPNEQRPAKLDDDGTLTLGHELLHCMLGNYHR
jgi:hypothetical protein